MSVFVDTGAWFAYFVRRDPDHNLARDWVSTNESPLVTSDYITSVWGDIPALAVAFRCRGKKITNDI